MSVSLRNDTHLSCRVKLLDSHSHSWVWVWVCPWHAKTRQDIQVTSHSWVPHSTRGKPIIFCFSSSHLLESSKNR